MRKKSKTARSRLKFSIVIIIANFIVGIYGMLTGKDLTAIGTFLALSNTPLYAYIIGETYRKSVVPDNPIPPKHTEDESC